MGIHGYVKSSGIYISKFLLFIYKGRSLSEIAITSQVDKRFLEYLFNIGIIFQPSILSYSIKNSVSLELFQVNQLIFGNIYSISKCYFNLCFSIKKWCTLFY